MSEESVVVEATPTEVPMMDVSRGPLVDITSEQRAEFRKTGELPGKPKETPKKSGEAAPSSDAKPEEAKAKPAGESETPTKKQEPKKQSAEERIAQLEATIEKIRKGSEQKKPQAETSAPAKTEPKPPPYYTRPRPTIEEKNPDGTPKFKEYEDYLEDLGDWKADEREFIKEKTQRETEQANKMLGKVEEAKTRYENFAEVVAPAVDAFIANERVSPVVKQMLNDSDVFADLFYTIANDPAEFAKFVKMAEKEPGKAIRYIALTESLIAEELESKAKPASEEIPVKPKTQAPKPPSETGGRAAAPPDAEFAAVKAGDFRAAKAEFNRKALAKLKG